MHQSHMNIKNDENLSIYQIFATRKILYFVVLLIGFDWELPQVKILETPLYVWGI